MGEERNCVDNSEIPAKEESKIPLTDGSVAIEVKSDSGEIEEFRGLTKEELLQYAQQPFWVRLRMALLILFWASWVAMLVVAILIIVKAPRCEPLPTATWLQKSAILEIDPSTPPEDATEIMKKLGLSSLYFPDLISHKDYKEMKNVAQTEKVKAILEAVASSSYQAVTDFMPDIGLGANVWNTEATPNLIDSATSTFQYNSSHLQDELVNVFKYWQTEYKVNGFLVPTDNVGEELANLTTTLNDLLNPDITIGERTADLTGVISQSEDVAEAFRNFAIANSDTWTYYKMDLTKDVKEKQALTLALMTLPGTPVLQVRSGNLTAFTEEFKSLLTKCGEFRQTDALQLGETSFVNSTSNVTAFTRTFKGTPGYAVAVNLGEVPETVDFKEVKFVADQGTILYELGGAVRSERKVSMDAIKMEPLSGIIIQFVAQYKD